MKVLSMLLVTATLLMSGCAVRVPGLAVDIGHPYGYDDGYYHHHHHHDDDD